MCVCVCETREKGAGAVPGWSVVVDVEEDYSLDR